MNYASLFPKSLNPIQRLLPVATALLMLLSVIATPPSAWAQEPTIADTYVDETKATNFGAAATLDVMNPNLEAFIKFDLSSLPGGTKGTSVGKATLVLYAGTVTSAGTFDVHEVGGAWGELTLTNANEPALGTLISAAVPIALANKNNFVFIDVTTAVKDWLNNTVVNNGLVLVPNGSGVNVTFNSKESVTTSHVPQLLISLVEPPGEITKITAGAGLTGGGITGNVPLAVDSTQVPFLSFANTFTANQTVNGNLAATTLSGNGSAVTSVNASLLNGLASSAFAITGGPNAFARPQSIGTTSTIGTLTIFGTNGPDCNGLTVMFNGTTGIGCNSGVLGYSSNGPGVNGESGTGVAIYGSTLSGSDIAIFAKNGVTQARIDGAGSGFFNKGSIGTTNSFGTLTILGTNGPDCNGLTVMFNGTSGVGCNSGVLGYSSNGPGVNGESGTSVAIYGSTLSGSDIAIFAQNGINQARIDSTGKGFFNGGTQTGGADFAESVAVRGKRSQYAPGDLMVIDPAGHRRLALARAPYSSRVAGIFSTKPGVLATPHPMDDGELKDEVPLAVIGIVPCKVTAENGPIEVGDLLVSSSLPGHAMKGTNRSRMLGAVVGKALEPLHKGQGVIQVLVTLQ